MEISGLLKMAATSFINSKGSGSAGSNLDVASVASALGGLIGNKDGGFDISSIMGGMQSGDMGNILTSWMASGDNDAISSNQISQIFNSDKISAFSQALGINKDEAIGGLQDAIPNVVDEATNDSSFLDSIGGINGAMNLASKFF